MFTACLPKLADHHANVSSLANTQTDVRTICSARSGHIYMSSFDGSCSGEHEQSESKVVRLDAYCCSALWDMEL